MCPVLERVRQGPDCTKQTGVASSQKKIQALKPQSHPPSHLNPEPLRPLGMLGRQESPGPAVWGGRPQRGPGRSCKQPGWWKELTARKIQPEDGSADSWCSRLLPRAWREGQQQPLVPRYNPALKLFLLARLILLPPKDG